jgi:hypothetical protein
MHALDHATNVIKACLIQFHIAWLLKYYPILKKYDIWTEFHLKHKHVAVVFIKFSINIISISSQHYCNGMECWLACPLGNGFKVETVLGIWDLNISTK